MCVCVCVCIVQVDSAASIDERWGTIGETARAFVREWIRSEAESAQIKVKPLLQRTYVYRALTVRDATIDRYR